jgi:hypothetical protein
MTIQITRPEIEAPGTYTPKVERERREAIQRLKSFGKTHGLSLGGMSIRELCDQARP